MYSIDEAAEEHYEWELSELELSEWDHQSGYVRELDGGE